MINRCIGCHYYDSKENVCIHGSPIFIDDICTDYQDSEFVKQIRSEVIDELKSLLRCRNYRGCAVGKGCDGVCNIDSDICKSCENFGIPYSLFEQMRKGAENE